MAKKGGLGKGLDALFMDNAGSGAGTLMTLRIGEIEPNKDQPRDLFEPQPLQELADSIRENGLLQPIVVRQTEGGTYQIVAGERRWRACRLAGLTEIPAVIVEADTARTMELALIENLQREDLTPIEVANGYKALMEQYGLTQEEVAKRLGKSRPAVSNSVRMLKLPIGVRRAIQEGRISAGHAKVLAGMDNMLDAECLAQDIMGKGLTVRETERIARLGYTDDGHVRTAPRAPRAGKKTAWRAEGGSLEREIEISVAETTGRHIRITPKGDGGVIEVHYVDRDDLQKIAQALGKL